MQTQEPKPVRKIIHVDMDAFFASVEQRDFPDYRGKPIVVGGPPQSRGVVATASYEARKFGIRSAMPCSHAYRLCPDAIFVPPRFDAYKEASNQIRSIFETYTDLIEPLSLDEAFLDVTENKPGIASAVKIARLIKKEIKELTGLTASAGVSHTKFLAKIASDLHKPDGLTLILPEKAQEFIDQLPIGKIFGIGKATETKMKALGIHYCRDLKTFSLDELQRHFGKSALHYYNMARGVDNRAVKPDRIRKSVGAERTFEQDVSDKAEMLGHLRRIAGILNTRLSKINASGKTVTLKVKYDDFEQITRSITLPDSVCEEEVLYEHTEKLMDQTEIGQRSVRLLGISVSNLDGLEITGYGRQLELFEAPKKMYRL